MSSDPLVVHGVTVETAAEHACDRVPVMAAGNRSKDVRRRMQGQRYECASHIVVCAGPRILGVVRIESGR